MQEEVDGIVHEVDGMHEEVVGIVHEVDGIAHEVDGMQEEVGGISSASPSDARSSFNIALSFTAAITSSSAALRTFCAS